MRPSRPGAGSGPCLTRSSSSPTASRVAAELARGRPGIAYGLGRSYGDACLNPDGVLWRTAGLDRFISLR